MDFTYWHVKFHLHHEYVLHAFETLVIFKTHVNYSPRTIVNYIRYESTISLMLYLETFVFLLGYPIRCYLCCKPNVVVEQFLCI